MLKRIYFLAAMFAICTYAQDNVETEPAPIEAAEAAEITEAVETESVLDEAAEVTETVEAEPALVAEPVPDQPATATVITEAPAKEAIIENPIEFAIVTAIFIATVLLIALTGN